MYKDDISTKNGPSPYKENGEANNNHPGLDQDDGIILTSLSRCYVGSPLLDVATFLMTSLSSEQRLQHTDKLLENYYNSLCEQFKKLNIDVSQSFPNLNVKMLSSEYER